MRAAGIAATLGIPQMAPAAPAPELTGRRAASCLDWALALPKAQGADPGLKAMDLHMMLGSLGPGVQGLTSVNWALPASMPILSCLQFEIFCTPNKNQLRNESLDRKLGTGSWHMTRPSSPTSERRSKPRTLSFEAATPVLAAAALGRSVCCPGRHSLRGLDCHL